MLIINTKAYTEDLVKEVNEKELIQFAMQEMTKTLNEVAKEIATLTGWGSGLGEDIYINALYAEELSQYIIYFNDYLNTGLVKDEDKALGIALEFLGVEGKFEIIEGGEYL